MFKKLLITVTFVAVLAVPTVGHAALQDDLFAQIESLLRLVSSLQEQLNEVTGASTEIVVTDFTSCAAVTGIVMESYPRQCAYNGQTFVEVVDIPIQPPLFVCPVLKKNLWFGTRGVEVSSLQHFLKSAGTYTYPEITGYFGPATQRAVELWQAQNGVVSFGAPETTGYGVVGPATRAAVKKICGGIIPKPVPPEPVACTLEYAPVCGQQHIQCITTPCNPIKTTYGNACQLKAAGAEYLYAGECRPDKSVGTKPIIHGFSGPTILKTNETGVWEIKASDPQNGRLEYKIDWGEKRANSAFDAIAALAGSGFVQSTTFSHAYAFAGTYTVTIVVRDAQGLQATTTTTVHVSGTESLDKFAISPAFGGAPLTVTATITLPERNGLGLIEVCGPIVVGDIDWGDGSTSRPTRLGCSSQRVVTVNHTYTSTGTYTVLFERMNGIRFTEKVEVLGSIGLIPFIANPLSGEVPLIVTFTAPGGSSCVDGPDYSINYGDGIEEMTPLCNQGQKTIQHTYTKSGVYTATLYQIPSGFGGGGRTPSAVGSQTIIVGGTTNPWGPTCTTGTSYGGSYYEQCNTQ